jgi:hypothetical protein
MSLHSLIFLNSSIFKKDKEEPSLVAPAHCLSSWKARARDHITQGVQGQPAQ